MEISRRTAEVCLYAEEAIENDLYHVALVIESDAAYEHSRATMRPLQALRLSLRVMMLALKGLAFKK